VGMSWACRHGADGVASKRATTTPKSATCRPDMSPTCRRRVACRHFPVFLPTRHGRHILLRPKVTVDASLVAYKHLGTSLHPSDSVIIISTALAKRNVDVYIICDPPTRHHSKRAHHQRVGKKEISKLQLMLCRMELLRSGGDLEKAQKLTNTIQRLEKAESRVSLPLNFISKLEVAVEVQHLWERSDFHGYSALPG
jgi:hypothetical protein